MSGLLVAFFSSFITTLLIIRFKHLHGHLSADFDLSGPQKFHTKSTPRIGGIAITVGLFLAILLRLKNLPEFSIEVILLLCAIPTFAIGLTEDLTKTISVRIRLIFTSCSAALMVLYLNVYIVKLDIPFIDYLFTFPVVGVIFTIFAMTGLANAYNIIDGFNGLASGTVMICFTALGLIAWQVGDLQLVQLCVIMTVVISGFFVVNFPFGKIFMGDGGAYLLGFLLAWVAVMLPMRNPQVSVWAPLLVCGYPVIETVYSIARRYWNKTHASYPDSAHLHSLIKVNAVNRLVPYLSQSIRNSLVAPLCWIFTFFMALIAVWYYSHISFLVAAWFGSFFVYAMIYDRLRREVTFTVHQI